VAVAADIAFVAVGNPAAVDSPGGEDLVEEVRSSRGMAAGTEVVGCNSPGSTWLQRSSIKGTGREKNDDDQAQMESPRHVRKGD